MAEDYYWVIHIVGGQRILHGSYKSRKAAEVRADRIHGGEVHVFRSWSNNPQEVEREFVGEVAAA